MTDVPDDPTPPSFLASIVSTSSPLPDAYALTPLDAERWAAETREPGLEVDVMRVLPHGQLTTEY